MKHVCEICGREEVNPHHPEEETQMNASHLNICENCLEDRHSDS